ncbi:lantibiotic dehydratase [Xanthomonas fragariae]|nr:lantibiotic dehydratase [Xanthomonas fragariae]
MKVKKITNPASDVDALSNGVSTLAVCSKRRKADLTIYAHDRMGIIRVPIYTVALSASLIRSDRKQLAELICQLLTDPIFLEAIYIASPSLYEKALNWLSGDLTLPDIDLAIARYALRMAHRSVPFGTFSSVAAVTVGPGENKLQATPAEEIKKSAAIDYGVLVDLVKVIVSNDLGHVVRYRPNDTITPHADYISYLKSHVQGSTIVQHIEQLERNEVLDSVLDATSTYDGMTVDEIAYFLARKYLGEYTQEEIHQFIQELKVQDVLVADSLIDATSSDQLAGLLGRLAAVPPEIGGMNEVVMILRNLADSPLGTGLDDLKRIRELIIEAGSNTGKSTHVVAFSSDQSGSFSEIHVQKVEAAIDALAEFIPKNDQLSTFRDCFVERFGEASVALSDLLPFFETMGYPDGVRPVAPLADCLASKKVGKSRAVPKPLNAPESYAVAMLALSGSNEFIDISKFRPREGSSVPSTDRPSCLVAWLALWAGGGDEVKIELKSCGAQEPGRLMGRFSGVIPKILEYLNEVESPSEGKIFAQIVGVPMTRAGNIISRPATAGPEIRVRAGGGANDILISDLEVFVSNKKVVLWSRSRQAEVVPRMNSAHAFENCKGFAVYVFLNHVANQDYICRMPSMRDKLPDAPFLPGLTYNGIIIERPSWRVAFDELGLSKLSDSAAIETLREWAKSILLPEMLEVYGKLDSTILSLCSEWTAKDFLKELRKNGTLTLTCAFPLSMEPVLRSASGAHMHEIQLALRNVQAPNVSVTARHPFDGLHGLEWVYVCVYCKAANQNDVILALHRAMKITMGDMVPFFFIRYKDPEGDHVRIRVRVKSPHERTAVMSVLEGECKKLEVADVICKFIFKQYIQEVERYLGPRLMKLAESIFILDSHAVMRTFGKIPGGLYENWRSAAAAVDSLLRALGVESLQARLEFAKVAAADFQREISFDLAQRKLIGEVFKKSKPIFLESGECNPDIACLNELAGVEEIRRLIFESEEFKALGQRDAYKYRWSLIHMRLNRVFARMARVQEAACWELLKRSYLLCKNKMAVEID